MIKRWVRMPARLVRSLLQIIAILVPVQKGTVSLAQPTGYQLRVFPAQLRVNVSPVRKFGLTERGPVPHQVFAWG
jgi:hypothetical protein